MNTIDDSCLEFPQLRIETVTQLKLGCFWNGIVLSGHHWRLYHHDKPGAALFANGHKVELLPEFIYLLPPYCNVTTALKGDPVQLFIHFQATGFSGNKDFCCNKLPVADGFAALLDAIYCELKRDNASNRCSLLAIALAANAMLALPPEAVMEMPTDRGVEQICERMRQAPGELWPLRRLAKISRVPEQQLLQRFRDATGCTPCRYLQHLRYARAARLLQSTDLDIETICEYIGVNDRFHFSRRFKAIYGAPPATYRKRYR